MMPSNRFTLCALQVLILYCGCFLMDQTAVVALSVNGAGIQKRVAVVGATGRTGRYAVQELLQRNNNVQVVAIVRDTEKAKTVFGEIQEQLNGNNKLEVVTCDLLNPQEIKKVFGGVDAAIWCATGFSSDTSNSMADKVKSLFGLATKRTIDSVGLPAIGQVLATKKKTGLPAIVVCSSGGVTRPDWDKAKKELMPGAADIPIVRINPFGILGTKKQSEDLLKNTQVDYCIVRPVSLADDYKWPANSRPIFAQGDVAVGRINRRDVARVLVEMLEYPEATNKTFEVATLGNYPWPASLKPALSRLYRDDENVDGKKESLETVLATYHVLQQLLPGEKQDAAALAMGQSYDQLDKNEVGLFGERGKEKVTVEGLQTAKLK